MEERYWLLLNKHADHSLNAAEQKELDAWSGHDPERIALLNNFREIRSAGEYEETPSVDTASAWLRLKDKITADPVAKKPLTIRQKIVRIVLTIVVAIVALISFHIFNNPPVTVATKAGMQKNVLLPDSSEVLLQENSVIAYPNIFINSNSRKVALKGSAFFKVNKDPARPFTIEADFTEITAVDAAFNVMQQNDKVIVTVVSGRLSFLEKANNANSLSLMAGERGTFLFKNRIFLKKTDTAGKE